MPVENYSVVQPSTQQKTFRENNICRFSIPFNSIPFLDPHESYLQVNMKADFDAKMRLNGNSSVIIKYIRISCGGQVLEEVDEFNQLAHIYHDYGNDDSSRSVKAVFNNDAEELFAGNLMGNQGASVPNGVKPVKLILPLDECGVFSALEVLPLMALGNNLDIEIRFAPDKEVVRCDCLDEFNKQLPTENKNKVRISNATTNGTALGSNANPIEVTLPYNGFTSLADFPYQIGDHIKIQLVDGTAIAPLNDVVISSIGRKATTALTDEPNQIQIEINAGAGVDPTATNNADLCMMELVKTTNNADNPVGTIEYSNVEWYIQKVVPPANYVNSLKKKLNSAEGFQLDIHTWTTYKSNLLATVQAQTIEIPAYQSRAKSVLIVPRTQNQVVTFNVDNTNGAGTKFFDFDGQHANLLDYQFQVNNGLRVPTRPVNLEVMNGFMRHLSAEHLIQVTQAVGSSNIPVKNIKNSHNNFLIGRQLSKYGGTSNLNSAMRVYLNYNAHTDPVAGLQTIAFVNHINRVSVNANGLQVFN
tara:strand:+ start:1525 stop:3114 length:1590 start_codon:yes stop_codon:yes gene_type:complete